MRPLVSGLQAKRYVAPETETRILFPYEMRGKGARLIPAAEMLRRFPKAWAYLSRFETPLRLREAKRAKSGTPDGPFVTAVDWHAFGRNQNLDKQHLPKLLVPRIVARLAAAYDAAGSICLDNVDVGGVLPMEGVDAWFLLGVLNGPVTDFVFRRITKPFRGNYGSANRQCIELLPLPDPALQESQTVAKLARQLQELHTQRRDTLVALDRRLGSTPQTLRAASFLFAGLPELPDWEARAPAALDATARRTWAKERFARERSLRETALREAIAPGRDLSAELVRGELRLLADGDVVLDRVFPTAAEAPFLLAQWKTLLSRLNVTERTSGKSLSDSLRSFAATDNPGLVEQVLRLSGELEACEADIRSAEANMNEMLFDLYRLTPAERELVQAK